MKCKAFLISVVCIMFLVVVFVSNTIASEKPFEGTKLTILATMDGKEGNKITQPYIPFFEEETGIEVEFVSLAPSSLHTKLATLFATESSDVDIVWTWAGWTAEFASAGYFEDLTNKLSKGEWEQFVPGVLNAITYDGKYYGIPKFFSIRSFLINKKLFKKVGLDPNKPPKIWDEFVSYAKKLTDPVADTWGVLHSYGTNNGILITFQEHLVLTGGRIVDENHNITFNNEKGVEALEKIVELNKLGVVDPASFGLKTGAGRRARWIQGHDGMAWGWSGDWMQSQSAESKIVGEVGVSLFPVISTSGAITGSEGYAISKFSNNKEAALEFLKYLVGPEIQKDIFLRTGWYPVFKTVLQDPELASASPLIRVVEEQSKYPTYRFAANYNAELTDILGPELLAAVNGEKTAEKALNDAAEVLKPIIEAYKK